MFCKKCGCELDDDSLFCVKCGTSVTREVDGNAYNVEPSTPGLLKAQCPNCGGNLDVDPKKYKGYCPYCNTPFMVAQAVRLYQTVNKKTVNNNVTISNPTVNIQSNQMTADKMFENWCVSHDERIERDFKYHYPADPRNEYMRLYSRCMTGKESRDEGQAFIAQTNKFLAKQSLEKYRNQMLEQYNSIVTARDENQRKQSGNLTYKEYRYYKNHNYTETTGEYVSEYEKKKLEPLVYGIGAVIGIIIGLIYFITKFF